MLLHVQMTGSAFLSHLVATYDYTYSGIYQLLFTYDWSDSFSCYVVVVSTDDLSRISQLPNNCYR